MFLALNTCPHCSNNVTSMPMSQTDAKIIIFKGRGHVLFKKKKSTNQLS